MRLERLVAMALLLSARRRLRAEELAAHFSVTLRTVYRDVRALQDAGFPVQGTAGDGYRVAQDGFLRPLALTESEAEALTLSAQIFAASADGPLRESLQRATAKLESALEPAAKRRVRDLLGQLTVPAFARRDPGPMAAVLESLRTRTVARIGYRDFHGKPSTRDIEPLGVVYLGDAWLVLAYCRTRAAARAFRLDRIGTWLPLQATFDPRPGLSFGEVLARESAAYEARRGS